MRPSWYGYIVRYDPARLDGSTCPLNQLPLFRNPTALFPDSIVTLPVWHTADGMDLAARYAEAFRKISAHHHELLS